MKILQTKILALIKQMRTKFCESSIAPALKVDFSIVMFGTNQLPQGSIWNLKKGKYI